MNNYRHELKYLLNAPDAALLHVRLAHLMQRDPNAGATGVYSIRSLYFDDLFNTAARDKEDGQLARRKYRIRLYNLSDNLIRLERKLKYDTYIKKESAPMTRAEAEAVIGGEYKFLRHSEHNLLREFYVECTSNLLRPRVIVDYEREPFVCGPGDVRITYDRHVRAGLGAIRLFDRAMPACEVLRGDQLILEVKYTQFLPGLVRRLLQTHSSELTAASKYLFCAYVALREKNMNRTEGLPWMDS